MRLDWKTREKISGICVWVLILLWLVIAPIVSIHFAFVYSPSELYDINKAEHWLCAARGTVDLLEMADYMEKGLNEVQHRTGNPCWWYPTAKTDFDTIKEQLRQNIAMCREVAGTTEKADYGYQRCVDNVQEVILDVTDHLETTETWLTWLRLSTVIWLIVFAIANIITFVVMMLLG